MEQFVQRVVVGGVAIVAGLWGAELATPASAPWIAGVVVAVAGAAGLGIGIRRELAV